MNKRHTPTRWPCYCPCRDSRMEDCGMEGYTEEEEDHGSRQELHERNEQQNPDNKEWWTGKDLPPTTTEQYLHQEDMGRCHQEWGN
jgi:hypothetical protein